jgi:dynein heavy chain
MAQHSSAAYLELLSNFRTLWLSKEKDLLQQKERYNVGLCKLQFAASQVVVMQEELRSLQPQLVDTSAETESLMVKIEQDTVKVEAQKEIIAADESLANEAAAAAQAIKDECESDLAEATPALDAAINALDTLKPADITLVKSMRHPPSIVKLVMHFSFTLNVFKLNRLFF